jgi:eukaryotic-like serine/threonine-protein kinase
MPTPSSEVETPEQSADIEPLLSQFEAAWQTGRAPALDELLRAVPEQARAGLAVELIKVDLEYRWCTPGSPVGDDQRPPTASVALSLEDYAARLPELGPAAALPLELIEAEYRVRCWCGRRPSLVDFVQRFGERRGELAERLQRIDAELAREAIPVAPPLVDLPPQGTPVAPPSVSALLEALRDQRLLSLTYLNELILADLQGHFADPHALARFCVQRGWLTDYQVDLLLQGRHQELSLGAYLILSRLGEGASGVVFKARHRSMNRLVALKVFRPELLGELDADGLRRFYQEIRAAGQLAHPHVVHAYDAGPAGSLHFLAMEYLEGTDLGRLVAQSGPLPVGQACSFIRQATLGLEHAWRQGLVHRDIKPNNLFLTRAHQGEAIKVLDFGLARLQHSSGSSLTRQTDMMGTADFMAPEQATNPHGVDVRADLYSLGCTLYHLLAARPPFAGGTFIQKVERHRWQEPEPVERLRGDVPGEVAALIRNLMAKNPADRYQTPTEVLAALPAPADVVSPAIEVTSPAAPRRSLRGPLVLGCSLLAAGIVLVFLLQPASRDGKGPSPTVSQGTGSASPVEAEWQALLAREANPRDERAALRGDVLAFRQRHAGTAQALEAARLLQRLPSPFDVLSPDKLSLDQRTMAGSATNQNAPAGLVAVLGDSRKKHRGAVRTLAVAPGKPLVALGSPDDFAVELWDPVAGKTGRLEGHKGEVYAVAFSPDGQLLASAGDDAGHDYGVTLWNVATGRVLHTLVGHQNAVDCLAFHPDGKTLISGALDHTLKLWDVASGKELRTLWGHKVYLTAVAFSPDGELLASGSDDTTVRVWDGRSGEKRYRPLSGHLRQISGVTFKDDGKLLASGSRDNTVRLWETTSGKERTPLHFDGHSVTAVAFAPVGSRLAVGSADGTLRIVDSSGGTVETIIRLGPASGEILQIAFSPDGRHLATANAAGTAYILRLTGK